MEIMNHYIADKNIIGISPLKQLRSITGVARLEFYVHTNNMSVQILSDEHYPDQTSISGIKSQMKLLRWQLEYVDVYKRIMDLHTGISAFYPKYILKMERDVKSSMEVFEKTILENHDKQRDDFNQQQTN